VSKPRADGALSLRNTPLKTQRMPVLFIGHGSPMNAIEDNPITQAMAQLGRDLPRPKALLVISAHWMTRGTWVTSMQNPRTIHDFHGFPKELFEVQYPAPGSPELAKEVQELVKDPPVGGDPSEWGIDHGTWSVLRHLYPDADIPVVQLSLDMTRSGAHHLAIGEKLRELRERGVMIVGSGNIVHNLRRIRWEPDAASYDWALEFDAWTKSAAERRDFKTLAEEYETTEAGRLSVPTPDHYYPLLYALGASDAKDELRFDIEGMQNGSISMRSLRFTP
jgi:4,5-DOPA dioxygenase extradiol